jgi:hypothetical protein
MFFPLYKGGLRGVMQGVQRKSNLCIHRRSVLDISTKILVLDLGLQFCLCLTSRIFVLPSIDRTRENTLAGKFAGWSI